MTATPYTWYSDPRMLAAGNARGLPDGDPLALPTSPAGPTSRAVAVELTADEIAEIRRAAYARLQHPNRKSSPRRSRRAAR